MSTIQQPPEPERPEEATLPPGFDPTRDVMPPRSATATARPHYQPLSGRAAAATAVLGLLLVLDIAAVVSGYFEVQLLDRLAAGENVPDAQLDANDTRQGMIALGQTALWVASAIAFISWLHRAYKNMDAIGPPYRRWGTGWSIGAWFVPFLNLWRPKQIVNDVWNSGTPAAKGPPFWLHLWWAGWLISTVLGRVAFPNLAEDATLQELRTDTVNYMVSDGFDIAVLALAILVVRGCTRRQQAKADAPARRPAAAAPLPWAQAATAGPEPAAAPQPAGPEGPRPATGPHSATDPEGPRPATGPHSAAEPEGPRPA